ncbi:MAG: pantoate--beta-alanine ligase [Alphaproteobacteria bacterium]|nr:pantoate--beta-alanine ligase [Alphaproteobacteria bacterium]|tara:strand:+ start:6959 stop:7732 length:774 start_codon:yes stop_codon:yes gene_type:complete
MHRFSVKDDLQAQVAAWKAAGEKVAFVPTMGALHEGHLSLVALARTHAQRVVVSVYVNPTQFAPHEDFDSYPRDVNGDAAKLASAGVDALYTPDAAQMYPGGDMQSPVQAGTAAAGLETDFRPHFFEGVVNVVYRLFDHVKPDVAVFGEKDFQQLQVISEMVAAQSLPITIVGAPIARDPSGLALSSRNAYLSEDELVVARQLNVILRRVASGDIDEAQASEALIEAGFAKVDYVAQRWGRVLGAAWLGKTRLIDNL